MKRPLTLLLTLFSLTLLSVKEAQAQDPYWDAAYGAAPAVTGGAVGGGGGGLFGASAFNYGYFDFGYFNYDFASDLVDSSNGFSGKLSIPIVDSLYVAGGLAYASPDLFESGSLDYLTWNAGVGLGVPIGGTGIDFVIEGGVAHQSLDGTKFHDSFDGYGFYVSPGVRVGFGELVELNGGVTFVNIDSDSNVEVDVKALLHLTPSVSLFGEAGFAEEVNQYGVGLRIGF